MPVQAIVTDIEGTTSSISFVHDILFPYAREHLPAFVTQHVQDPEVRALLDEANAAAGGGLDDEQVVAALLKWIDQDRKITPLKALQGLIWEQGYRHGALKGHLYADVRATLERWHEQGIRLYVFSSGSVKAQQLLFAHTEFGDLTPLFSAYFDTHIGSKRETAAYRHIVETLGLPANEILFISDVPEELDAAQQTGMQVLLLARDGTVPTPNPWRTATSFVDVQL